jgi:phosphoglycolate phosphatase
MKKLVILDCDGTLVDSQNGICEAMTPAFSGLGLPVPSRAATLAIVGLSLPEAFAALAPDCTPAQRCKLSDRYKSAFLELKRDAAHHEPLFEGVGAAIEALMSGRKGVVLGIATGKSRRGIDRLFAREGWAGHFLTVQTAGEHPSKPHPAMVLAAMAEAGVGPKRTVMVGDTTLDMEMARAAGSGALGVAWGYHPVEELRAAGAHAIVQACQHLPCDIDANFSRREQAA